MRSLEHTAVFQKVTATLMAVVLTFVTTPMISDVRVEAAKTVEELQQELSDLQKDKTALTAELNKLGDSISDEEEKLESYKVVMANVKDQIAVYQQQIDAVNLQISEKNNAIAAKNQEIKKTNQEIAEKEKQAEATNEQFKERLTAMYVSSGDSSVLSILFGAESFSDFLTRAEVMKNIADSDNALMEQLIAQKEELQSLKKELEASKAEIEEEKAEIEKKKADIVALQANVQAKSAEYNDLISESKSIISNLEAKEEKTQANIDALKKEDDYIRQMILAAQKPPKKEESSTGGSSSSSSGSTSSGGYIWPVPNYSYVSTEFNTAGSLWTSGYHSGMDLAAPGGSYIYACRGGTVTIAKDGWDVGYKWANGGYGNYIVIDHGDGYQTLYAHLQKGGVKVTAGQYVSPGQLIGLVGTTGNSTGNHLHLEVRYQGVCQNPRKFVKEP